MGNDMDFIDWENRYAVRRFRDFAQGLDDPAIRSARNLVANDFGGKAVLITGDIGEGKSCLVDILLARRNCHRYADDPCEPCGTCDGCLGARSGRNRHTDLIRRFTPCDGDVKDFLTEEAAIWSVDRHGAAQSTAQFVVAFDDVHFHRQLDLGWLQGMIDRFGGKGIAFVLSTSEPKQLPASLRSRCNLIHMVAPNHEQLVPWLQTILRREEITFDPEVPKRLISRASRRPRTILKLAEHLAKETRRFTVAAVDVIPVWE